MPGRLTDGSPLDHEQRKTYLQLERRLLSAIEGLNEGVRRAAVLAQLDGRTQAPEVLRAAELLERLFDACATVEITLARRGSHQAAPIAWPLLAAPNGLTDEALRRRFNRAIKAADISADVARGRQLSNDAQRLATRLRQLLPASPASETSTHIAGAAVLYAIESLQASVHALRKASAGRLPSHNDETVAVLGVCFNCQAVVQVVQRATVVLARSAKPPLSWASVGEALHLRSRQATIARYASLDDADAISALLAASWWASEVNDISTASLIDASTTGRAALLAARTQAAEARRMDASQRRGRRVPRDTSQSWKELEKDPAVVMNRMELADNGLLPPGSEYYDPKNPNDVPR